MNSIAPCCFTAALLASVSAVAEPTIEYGFIQLGQLQLNDSETTVFDGSQSYSGELDDLPFINAGVQKILGGETFRYGYEGGALVSWQNDDISYAAKSDSSGGTLKIKVNNELFMFGTFLGVLGDIKLSEYARIHVSTGPMLAVASVAQEQQEDPENLPESQNGTIIIDGSKREFGFGYGWYAGAGIAVLPVKNTEIGLAVRQQALRFSFSDDIYHDNYDGTIISLSIGYKM
ncbi:hypothetical protein SIN8267_01393 [Sinobacterium norvegicum]|uniref:Outer membrane protein beta-barrel domain-containing protein n=1 Tax=Sinobacterium norvegicum TaxID=1641715 RepID=A0ABM9ADK9_9GAMM|nr:hypothetical protein [Sinobacterium norvegicum]CAH0991291.1 hypothetical protein SIN8267_01393 [Sinobacterium norvegicum]